MYICICNAVNDKAIRKAVDDGVNSWKELVRNLNVATQCGRCAIEAKSLFDLVLAEKSA